MYSKLSNTPVSSKSSDHASNFFKGHEVTAANFCSQSRVSSEDGRSPETKSISSARNMQMDGQSIIRLKRLISILGISRSSVYLKINPRSKYYDPLFPKNIHLGEKTVGWVLSDVYDYIERLRRRAHTT